MGLPSAEEVRSLLQDNKPLTIEHFHEHWLINKVVEPIRRSGNPVVEPASVVLDTNHYLEQIRALPAQQQELVLAQVRTLLESATNGPKEPSVVKKGEEGLRVRGMFEESHRHMKLHQHQQLNVAEDDHLVIRIR
ncbi:hypothetical protein GEMRC1_005247 [Eukaryota sp. GEM-RC1]